MESNGEIKIDKGIPITAGTRGGVPGPFSKALGVLEGHLHGDEAGPEIHSPFCD